MAQLTVDETPDERDLAAIQCPRDDFLVAEDEVSPGRFVAREGPFDRYERRVELEHGVDGSIRVRQHIDFRLAAPLWRILLHIPVKRSLGRGPSDTVPWWAPPDRFDTRTTRTVSLLCLAMIATGYLGAVIGQTATFASDEFGTSDRAQGILFAAVRLGTLLTLVVTTMADRHGRRRLLLLALLVGSVMTMAGAASTGLWTLGGTQAIARGMATAISLLVGIMAAEVTPRSSRAYVASVLSLTAGLGAGMVVWILPVADIDVRAWRLIYVVPVIVLPLTWWLARHLSESDRFRRHVETARPDTGGTESMQRSRLALVAAIAFFVLLFAAPASQFRNDFLRDERGFSAAEVSLFVVVTNTPVGIGVAIAGKLADRRGRRPVGAFAVFGGAALTVATYAASGWGMWTASVLASIIGSMAAPALGVYSAEMFGTARRGRANGLVSLIGLGGSALGLLIVGDLSERLGSFAAAFAVAAVGPLIVVALVLLLLPETARRELEDINPVDSD